MSVDDDKDGAKDDNTDDDEDDDDDGDYGKHDDDGDDGERITSSSKLTKTTKRGALFVHSHLLLIRLCAHLSPRTVVVFVVCRLEPSLSLSSPIFL